MIESIIVRGPTQVGLPSAIASGSVLNPAANATIANISAAALAAVAPAGTLWNVSWLAELQGTIGAGDAHNMYLSSPLNTRSGEHTSELQSRQYLVCRLLLGKKKITA